MPFNIFKHFSTGIFSKNYLGIDIGTSSIKIVELSDKKKKRLANYGQLKSEYFAGEEFRRYSPEGLLLSNKNIIQAIGAILKEAKMKAKRVFFSIPDYSTFFTSFELPHMSAEELKEAIKYEAPRHIPLPVSDVTLDWQVIKGVPGESGRSPLKILLVAVPNQVINQYQEIADALNLQLIALEAEVFALARALIKFQDKQRVVSLIDIGARSTTINIVSKGLLKASYSIDIAGEDFTRALVDAFQVDQRKAEIIKRIIGIEKEETIKGILIPLVGKIIQETQNIFHQYFAEEREKIDKIILAGGNALIPGLSSYLSNQLNLSVEIANPFLDLSYPPGLEEVLKKLGPEFTIAVGVGLRGLEE
ncbi:type IV pilus assembly protein PilM [bacterium]|nr:type IV pilus assembly protein PilM [bacterium]